jgi:septum formation protein
VSRIILASTSTVRRKLLANAGIKVRAVVHDVDEKALIAAAAATSTAALARLLAEAKAISVSRQHPQALVIGADQTLDLEGRLVTKPNNRKEARAQLQSLAGRMHKLHSAFAIARNGHRLARQARTAKLTMRALDDREIDRYLEEIGRAATASVGAYQLEGLGIQLFERINGDYFTILGLPMLPLLATLRRLGAIA